MNDADLAAIHRSSVSAGVLRTFEELISGPDGGRWGARVCGRLAPDGRWEGWVEFVPEIGRPVLRSRRETVQSDLRNLRGWVDGLTRIYLEGALGRTLEMQDTRPPAKPWWS